VLALIAPVILASAQPAADQAQAAVSALAAGWPGVYDDQEQVVLDNRGPSLFAEDSDRRVRTIVAPVTLPWLGSHVLYLEELLHDDADAVRRQVLLVLEPWAAGARGGADAAARGPDAVRVQQFTFREPARWRELYGDARLQQQLRASDLTTIAGCDLALRPEGEQFRGGTSGRGCLEPGAAAQRYVDYHLLVGHGLYWYHLRLLRSDDDELVTEALGYDWFELHQARLFACRIRWSRSDRPGELAPVAILNLHDQGGRARFTTPDGRAFELELHSRDWPFDPNREALILVLRETGAGAALTTSWADLDAQQIGVTAGALDVRCGPLAREDGADS
jgi:hypothetical protein